MDYVSGIGLYLHLLQKKDNHLKETSDACIERRSSWNTRSFSWSRLFRPIAYAVPRRMAMIDLLRPKILS